MVDGTIEGLPRRAPILDRSINLTAVSSATIAWVVVLLVAASLRLAQLGHFPLSTVEARLADDAYRFFYGQTTGPGNALSNTGPTAMLLESLSFFLFGASDTVARLAPALLGIAMVLAVLGLRPIVGQGRALGMAALLALSPTLVYISRIATSEIYVAAFSLMAMVALLRVGLPALSNERRRFWAVVAGVTLAAAFGSGPSSLSVLIALGFAIAASTALDPRPENAVRSTIAALRQSRESVVALAAGFGIALIALFSQLFTDFSALAGIGETFADWGRLLSTASSATPTQFFLLVVLLYEILAVLLAIVAASQAPREPQSTIPWSLFALWFAVALLIFSFSSGSAPEHAIHVVLPLVLLGGAALGELVERLNRQAIVHSRLGTMLLVFIGLMAAIFAELVLLGRIDNAPDQGQALFEAGATLILAVAPLAYAAYVLIRSERVSGERSNVGATALLAAVILLGAFTFRSSIMLSFFNADQSVELLAQRTSTPAVQQIVHRVTNLSRDTTLLDGSARDPEGGHGLTIAIDRRVQWPYRWYFREFPGAIVVAEGQAPLTGAQVVITPDDTDLAEAGYTPQDYPTINRVPASYLAPNFSNILKGIVLPSHWQEGVHYLLFRKLPTSAEPETVTVGLTGVLANRVTPNTGPFGLFERVGAGDGRGQFNQPRGIAVAEDGGQIYVVDMANARVEQFNADGNFVDIWGGGEDPDLTLSKTEIGNGPTGVAVGPDGLVYVCDTWNHRVVVLDSSGHVVREFGSAADTDDSPDASLEPGKFFGPRAIAIANDQIYVVDTGNERVQVFSPDGTFIRAWGGKGTSPTQFVEPVGIAIDAQGRIYVADSGNARISIFSSTGVPIEQWPVDAWVGSLYFEPYLAVDDSGRLYASSSSSGSVEVFDPSGTHLSSITQVEAERLEQPVGLAWSPDGVLLITDKARNAVFRYTPPISAEPPAGGIGQEQEASPESTFDEASPQAASPMSSPIASPEPSPTPVGNG
jgi:uncharacterized protein (TIGR03663 family)